MKKFFFILFFFILHNFNHLNALDVKEVNYYKDRKAWLVNDNNLPIVSIKFAFKAGSGLDSKGKKGTANLVSSLLDEGAGNYSAKEFKKLLADNSISLDFGVSHDNFYINLYTLKENLDLSFQLLDLALTKPAFKSDEIKRVKSNVKLALEQSYKDPNEIGTRLFREILFEEHPYKYDTLGIIEDIDKIKKKDLKSFLENYLTLDNLFISASGDISEDDLKKYLNKYFKKFDKNKPIPEISLFKKKISPKIFLHEKDLRQSSIYFAGEGISRTDPYFYPAYVMNYILGGGGFFSRLTTEVREKRGLVYSVYSYLYRYDKYNFFSGGAQTSNENVDKVIKIIKEELMKVKKEGVTEQELKDAKNYLINSYVLRLDSNKKVASILLNTQMDGLDKDFFKKRNEYINAVSLKDIKEVAKKILNEKQIFFLIIGNPTDLKNINKI
ncbi:MAG: putative zinc protease [Alphaproteobacteria bacterium MarineAlpha6_Bin3]|nr:MAG: putative zinc protease [Alphaproteobacteria bacterium MarineAlpha6_Bin3]